MKRGKLSQSWHPGPQGGYFIPVDPAKTRAAQMQARVPNVHRTKWTCVDCLKTFKDVPADVDLDTRRCPSCGGLAARVGTRFRPPRLTDLRGWKQAIDFLESGRWMGRADLVKRARAALAARRGRKA